MEKMYPMLFTTWKTYSKEQFLKDLIAGIVVAIIALPLSIALALASGVGPEQGIYTAIVAGFIISFLGGSQVQIAGHGRTGSRYHPCGHHFNHHGTLPVRRAD